MTDETRPSTKAARNERLKLEAQTMNALGLGLFAVGGLQPLLTGHIDAGAALKMVMSAAIAYILHIAGKWRLLGLED